MRALPSHSWSLFASLLLFLVLLPGLPAAAASDWAATLTVEHSMAQFVFHHDAARVPRPPRSAPALLAWAKSHPGRFTYPQPPDFLGSTFLKQTLLELTTNRAALYRPATEAEFAVISAPLWNYLDALHPVLWRKGRVFPSNGPSLIRHLGDGEVDIAISFNSSSTAGALVLVDFLLSPEAQARKQDLRQMGGLTVLALDKLTPADRSRFENLPRGIATPTPEELGQPQPELHPYWMDRLEKEWQPRYAAGR